MAFVAFCVSLGHSLAPDLWLLQDHCLLQIWPGQDAKFQEREEACKAFNEKHRWRKRGISILALADRVPDGVRSQKKTSKKKKHTLW